jgi:hypothetical protein
MSKSNSLGGFFGTLPVEVTKRLMLCWPAMWRRKSKGKESFALFPPPSRFDFCFSTNEKWGRAQVSLLLLPPPFFFWRPAASAGVVELLHSLKAFLALSPSPLQLLHVREVSYA